MEKLIEELKQDEGFDSRAYYDIHGYLTIGYGTKFPISDEECKKLNLKEDLKSISKENAEKLLMLRLEKKIKALHKALLWLENQPIEVQEILYNMAYQLGVKGLLKFKQTLKLIEHKRYDLASLEMLDSLWAKQTPSRAKRLSGKLGAML